MGLLPFLAHPILKREKEKVYVNRVKRLRKSEEKTKEEKFGKYGRGWLLCLATSVINMWIGFFNNCLFICSFIIFYILIKSLFHGYYCRRQEFHLERERRIRESIWLKNFKNSKKFLYVNNNLYIVIEV